MIHPVKKCVNPWPLQMSWNDAAAVYKPWNTLVEWKAVVVSLVRGRYPGSFSG
jgi:hypothetical protein